MSDYYRWISPFEEIERANQRAAHAREEGRNDVLEFEFRRPGLLQRALEDQAYKLAEKICEEQIRPTINDAFVRRKIRDATLDVLSFIPLKYMLPNIEARVLSSPVYSADASDFGVMTKVHMKPFRHAIMERLA